MPGSKPLLHRRMPNVSSTCLLSFQMTAMKCTSVGWLFFDLNHGTLLSGSRNWLPAGPGICVVALNPITYEDFLPVSAAGIFQSNLGDAEQRNYVSQAARSEFERDLGGPVLDEIELYRAAQMRSEHALQQRFLAESRL